MLNALNGFPKKLLAVVALVIAAPAFQGVSAADDSDKQAAPALDLNALMQKKLNAKMSGQLDNKKEEPETGLDSTLTDRIDEQKAETTEQLEAQSSTLTSANRAERKDKQQDASKEATAEASTQ